MIMALQEKYKELINAAQRASVRNLTVTESDNVLYINGTVSDVARQKTTYGISIIKSILISGPVI
jgi:hypothetical protein